MACTRTDWTCSHLLDIASAMAVLYICRLTYFSCLLIGFTLRSAVRPEPNGNPWWGLKASRTSNSSTCPPHVRTFVVALHETCTSFRFLSCVGIYGGFHLQKLTGVLRTMYDERYVIFRLFCRICNLSANSVVK